jgi:hypothetical protein
LLMSMGRIFGGVPVKVTVPLTVPATAGRNAGGVGRRGGESPRCEHPMAGRVDSLRASSADEFQLTPMCLQPAARSTPPRLDGLRVGEMHQIPRLVRRGGCR